MTRTWLPLSQSAMGVCAHRFHPRLSQRAEYPQAPCPAL